MFAIAGASPGMLRSAGAVAQTSGALITRKWLSYHRRMVTFDMRQYAEAGARSRLMELVAEADRIRRAFPGIEPDGAHELRGKRVARQQVAAARRGRRRTMTAAERKAVSARMKRLGRPPRAKAPTGRRSQRRRPLLKPGAGKRGARKGGSKKR